MAARTTFAQRHIGPNDAEISAMLAALGLDSLEALVGAAMPATIRGKRELSLPAALGEHEMLAALGAVMDQNKPLRTFIGCGYHDCITPPVIQRSILENPGWYTQYTPYQAEISQGRLEMLLNYQTLVSDLCGLPVANASLLDEATAAAEAMAMALRLRPRRSEGLRFCVERSCHPQTIAVVQTRAEPLGIEVSLVDRADAVPSDCFGWLAQYPDTTGIIAPVAALAGRVHAAEALLCVAADPLALVLFEAPGAQGADIVVGSAQRFGVPMGFGGPHAAFLACAEDHKRQMPGRLIGVSVDTQGERALRMALQTREQHIRRNRATSNICTAQVLLAVIAAAYACYHGPEGLRIIARRVRSLAQNARESLKFAGFSVTAGEIFDTVQVQVGDDIAKAVLQRASLAGIGLRDFGNGQLGISFDETSTAADIFDILRVFGAEEGRVAAAQAEALGVAAGVVTGELARTTPYMTNEVFSAYHSETELLRYLTKLQSRDLSLCESMIPLGSCTMKLNAAAEMMPVTWPTVGRMHPFAPVDTTRGYRELVHRLEAQLAELTGFAAISLQPNAGSQGEYAGLLAIRCWHKSRGDDERDVCLIPTSAHGTNPASAVMAGMRVVAVKCDAEGNIDVGDLRKQAAKHAERLAALMVTYPSTHGVFEDSIRTICDVVHAKGGQVYMDGANLNALLGHSWPADLGADVAHLNLHKTFCIPHGGGGPGVGPIGVVDHLVPFLPGHPFLEGDEDQRGGPCVAAAPFGSASILPISWAYIEMMGSKGLVDATRVAILNANYIAHRLEPHFPVLYRGPGGFVAHECIVDVRPLKKSAGVSVDDIAKRLMDYGFHAPTMSWPVAGTLMIEPTESESLAELDRFCDAMIAIRAEIQCIESGNWSQTDNPLVHSPHTASMVTADEWSHAYPRSVAAWPVASLRDSKFWPHVGRVDNAYGDRNLVCTCISVEEAALADA